MCSTEYFFLFHLKHFIVLVSLVYYCPQCKENTTTFPRYNKAKKLLETKEGRCGEYSNLFGLFCRSAGFETRLVLDLSDHLWTEVRLGDSWIMVDACEAVIDKPSMYEHGWGKKGLCYMIAIAPDHIMDITPRYTRSFLTEEFQTTRRQHTSSEEVSSRILQQLNDQLQSGLSANRLEELRRRKTLEEAELQRYKQTTEWTEQEKYGRGRISGSLAWKQSRQEAGRKNKSEKEDKEPQVVAGFEIEAFHPPISSRRFSLKVCQKPICSHDGIIVADTPCAIGEANSVSVVVVDEACLGCILQSRCFLTWAETKEFIDRLPSNRIVIMNGCCNDGNSKGKADNFDIPRLGGWQGDISSGVLFIGQVDVHPDWAFCSTLEDESAQDGHEVELEVPVTNPNSHKLRTERHTLPQRVAGRLPESAMPLKTQVLATEEQKRLAFTSFCASSSGTRYCGYTTTLKSPIYILDSTAYPFSKVDPAIVDAISKKNVWNTFHYLPSALVPEDDQGIATASDKASIPKYDVPLDVNFFSDSLGSQLLRQNNTRLPTSESLHNSRLIGLYFSAHWYVCPLLLSLSDFLFSSRDFTFI